MVRVVADEIGLQVFPKTSGSSRIHHYAAEANERVRQGGGVCTPVRERSRATRAKDRDCREDDREVKDTQVYVDWMQNARGEESGGSFTARANRRRPVSMPLTWK